MTGQTAIEAMSQSRRLSGGTTKAPEGGLGSSADADTHRATDGAVLGVEQWGWRVRFKADARRDAGPWSWQDQPLDEKTQQWAEQEPVYVGQQAATRDDTQPGTEKPSGFGVEADNGNES